MKLGTNPDERYGGLDLIYSLHSGWCAYCAGRITPKSYILRLPRAVRSAQRINGKYRPLSYIHTECYSERAA